MSKAERSNGKFAQQLSDEAGYGRKERISALEKLLGLEPNEPTSMASVFGLKPKNDTIIDPTELDLE
jgi:hypothetical protein